MRALIQDLDNLMTILIIIDIQKKKPMWGNEFSLRHEVFEGPLGYLDLHQAKVG